MKLTTNIRQSHGNFRGATVVSSRSKSLVNRRPAIARRVTASEVLNNKPVRVLDETIRLAQQGNAAAFETLYQLHSRRVYSLCLRMIGDPADAEDLTQEAFMQLFRKIHTFRGESAFSSWLHRLTANIVLMRFRKKTPPITSLDEMLRDDDESNRPKFEIGEQDLRLAGLIDRLNLDGAVGQLPEGYKLMFILHDVQGYEHNEIAGILGCSVGNSKSQLHKARKRLRELLQNASVTRTATSSEAGSSETPDTAHEGCASMRHKAQHSPHSDLSDALCVEA
jgi:RNA polymerase sigma-70 factor, ECF subfamily